MSRFNTTLEAPRNETKNRAGGPAYSQDAKTELTSLVLTSFLTDGFYESASGTLKRLRDLVQEVGDWNFVAKLAVFARREFGMRTITHVLAGEIGQHVKGAQWTRRFFCQVIRRPDDMLEIMSYFMHAYAKEKRGRGGAKVYRGIPNAMKRGFADRLEMLNEYNLAKYRGGSKDLSMVDLVNLVHPARTEAINALMNGTLGAADTWEANLSAAGQAEDSDAAKADVWKTQIAEKTIPQMALVRNLRNIIEQTDDDTVAAAAELLADPERVRGARIMLPYRYLTAYRTLQRTAGSRLVLDAVASAAETSVSNVPDFTGRTVVMVDTSSSMRGSVSPKSVVRHIDIAGMLAAALSKGGADLMSFASSAGFINAPLSADVMAMCDLIDRNIGQHGHGTSLASAFEALGSRKYDRVIVVSDLQAWQGGFYSGRNAQGSYTNWKTRSGSAPMVYSLDTAGLGSAPVSDNPNLVFLAGYSDKLFDIMSIGETDAMVQTVEAYDF